MKKVRFKAKVTYDGSGFYGWQVQPGKRTVQAEIERVLSQIFQQDVKIQGCGRTDTAVHAICYVFSFSVHTDMTPAEVMKATNSLLDKKIRIKEVSYAENSFHPRFEAQKKVYRYLITDFNSPFLINRAWYICQKLNIAKMKKAAEYIVGTHDFACFQASGRKAKNTVRTIEYIKIKRERCCIDPDVKMIAIEVCGTGFLYKMVRNIVGTLVDVGRNKKLPEQIKEIIESKDRKLASATAPGYGLYLKNVIYKRAS
ncbi:MAG TPA: tRNA pseudouridine(38-40) synthase TruA [bacterium]|nr:tRNA pseudouridine(38-40) synthase TruA [bacterium]